MRLFIISLVILAVCVFNTQSAKAQAISRCQDKDGKIIYTDKACEDLDAVPQDLPRPVGNTG